MAKWSLLRALVAAAGVALCVAVFFRGSYLLGTDCGVMYAAITLGIMLLLARSRTPVRAAVVAALSLPAGFAMAWPASINRDVQHFINLHAIDRAARTELAVVFASDPAYQHLSTSSVRLKVINVTIQGSLGTHSDLDQLRSRIVRECPALGTCNLYSEIALRKSEQRVEGLDRDLFPADK
jgi:hypothetical protein